MNTTSQFVSERIIIIRFVHKAHHASPKELQSGQATHHALVLGLLQQRVDPSVVAFHLAQAAHVPQLHTIPMTLSTPSLVHHTLHRLERSGDMNADQPVRDGMRCKLQNPCCDQSRACM